MWNQNLTQRFDDEERIQTEAKPNSEETPITETYRNPVRMFAVAMNMRRLAHSRRATALSQSR